MDKDLWIGGGYALCQPEAGVLLRPYGQKTTGIVYRVDALDPPLPSKSSTR
jgi:hypothetical protein